MNIVFIGMSGSGKSTFAAYCADLLKMQLIDLDAEICKNFGGNVPLIFASGGEALFRQLEEHQAVKSALTDNSIIATGGGTVLSETAMKALKKTGLVIYLSCDVQTLASRLSASCDERPLLGGEQPIEEKLQKIYNERSNLYLQYADIVLNESDVLHSRNLTEQPLCDQLGALYLELVLKLEKKVYAKLK